MPYISSRAAGGFGCTYSISSSSGVTVTYLLVGGGGGGAVKVTGSGSATGGGGGAGGMLYNSFKLTPTVTYNVVVGTGGAKSTGSVAAGNGNNTIVDTVTAFGGGGGGRGNSISPGNESGASGGSGGGGGSSAWAFSAPGGSGVTGQGNKGGDGGLAYQKAGGGGGAGTAGAPGVSANAVGGDGLQNSILGTSVYYAGGGAGVGGTGTQTGGLGGGGSSAGGYNSNNGVPGKGGGGAGDSLTAGNGGSGIAVLRSQYLATTTGGTVVGTMNPDEMFPMRTFIGNDVIYPFYSNGTITYTTTLASTITNYSYYFNQGAAVYPSMGGVVTPSNNNSFTVAASGDFTVECWCCVTNATTTDSAIISNMPAATGATGDMNIRIANFTSGLFGFVYDENNNANLITTPSIYKPGTWYHVALVRKFGSGLTLYVQGSAVDTYNGNVAITQRALGSAAKPMRIGSKPYQNGRNPFTGFISNVRIAKEAIYSGTGQAFTPATSNFTPTLSTWLLTLQNSTLIDNSTNNWTLSSTGTVAANKTNPFV